MENVCKEFKHGYWLEANDNRPDTVVVKDVLHYPDGRSEPHLSIYQNVKKPFWITKEYYRNHKQKKEAEDIDKLTEYSATQSDLPKEALRMLKRPKYGNVTMRDVRMSPYVYGCEIDIVTLIKNEYAKKCDKITPYSITFLDIEADPRDSVINLITVAMKQGDKIVVHTYANKLFLPFVTNFEDIVKKKLYENIPDEADKDTIDRLDVHIHIEDNELETIKATFKQVHEWQPDILTAWNAFYDITTIADRLIAHGIHPKDIFSDPRLPETLREIDIKQGRTTMVTQAGKTQRLDIQEQWHRMRAPASFYILDNMASFYFVRKGEKKMQGGYSIDNVVDRILKIGKLKFKELTNLTGAEYHIYMVKHHMVEYTAYNIWDVVLMVLLEEKTKDLSLNLPNLCGVSTFDNFNSTPSMIFDDFHFKRLEKGRVVGTKVVNEEFDGSLGRDDWVVTVDSWRTEDNGVKALDGYPIPTNLRPCTEDADQTSGYPSDTIVMGLSKENCVRELISIEGLDKMTFKEQNLNLMGGRVSFIWYAQTMFKAPRHKELLNIIETLDSTAT